MPLSQLGHLRGWLGGTARILIGGVLVALTITLLIVRPEVLRLGRPARWTTAEPEAA